MSVAFVYVGDLTVMRKGGKKEKMRSVCIGLEQRPLARVGLESNDVGR